MTLNMSLNTILNMTLDINQDAEFLAAKLNQETARISWAELQPFFARGQTIWVAPGLDLVDVGGAFATDQGARVAEWMKEGRVARVTDEQAETWHKAGTTHWAVVVAPWVLVQPEQ